MLTRSTTHAELMKSAIEIFQVLLTACSVTEGCLSYMPMRFRAHCTFDHVIGSGGEGNMQRRDVRKRRMRGLH